MTVAVAAKARQMSHREHLPIREIAHHMRLSRYTIDIWLVRKAGTAEANSCNSETSYTHLTQRHPCADAGAWGNVTHSLNVQPRNGS